jgi:hypothetical protein
MSLPLPSVKEEASYVIYIDSDGLVKAKNGFTGHIDYKGTDLASVINEALDQLDGGIVFVKSGIEMGDELDG